MGTTTSHDGQRPDFSPNQMITHLARESNLKSSLRGMLTRNARLNRIYSKNAVDQARDFVPTFYTEPLMHGEEPYHCPSGWRRYSLYIGLTEVEFQQKYDSWPVAYHGTSSTAAADIIVNGFQACNNGDACFIEEFEKAVFLTPSIKYAGHPRYARVEKVGKLYVQLVLQVRVNKSRVKKNPGTVEKTFSKDNCVDSNFKDNNELEWVFLWHKDRKIRADDGIVVYGVMARITETDPQSLPENQWWEESRERLKWDSYA